MRLNRQKSRFLKVEGGGGKDDLWPFLKEKVDLGQELRRPYEERWMINVNFLSGQQYVFYNRAAQLIQYLKQRKGRVRIVDNKILPHFQKQVSRLIRTRPRMSVVPASTDQEDIKAAKLGDKVLKYDWRRDRMAKKIRELAVWIYSCGNGFLEDRWNPKKGPMVFDGERKKMVYEGDVESLVWSPFDILVPAVGIGDMDLHSMPWMCKMRFRPLEYFESNYDRGGEVRGESRPIPYLDAAVLLGTKRSASIDDVEGAVEYELYVQPNSQFKKGLKLTGANGIILEKEDFPFDHYFMEQFKDVEVPGVFWGMATTEAAIQLQKIWNRTLSDIVEFNRSMARGKWLIPRNSRVQVEMDDSHGQRINYTPVLGHKPEMMDIKGLPKSYTDTLALIANAFMELYHQHEVTMGTNKSDIRSGDMVQLLLEQDDYGNIPTHAVFEEALEAHARRKLQRIQKGYKNERTIQVIGRGNQHDLMSFKGADLRDNTDVSVEKESSVPDSKMARQMRIKQNYADGLYGNPADEATRERVLRMLDEVPEDVADIFKESTLDRQIAQVENQAMQRQPGATYIVNAYDNHGIHVGEHNLARKQPEYQRLKFEDPQAFAMLEATFSTHLKMHQDFIREEMRAQEKRIVRLEQMKKGAQNG